MASKQVQDILIKLGIQGFEGLDKLKSSFRGLEKAIGPTDAAIQTARQSIIDFTGSGKQSIQSIQGQIEAFKGLQTQATIGGNVYRQLAGDVNRLSDTLKSLKSEYEEVGRAAKQTDAQIAAQFPARRPEAFRAQIAVLRKELDGLSVSARAYGDALTEITIRETAFGRAQARQGVIAGAQAVRAPLISAMQPQQQLPNTLAALQLRITELSQDFQNLDRTSQPYQETLVEINRLQNELSRATEDGNADRKEEIRGRIENYRAITAENAAMREQRQQRRSIERGRARTAGERVIEQPMRQISGLYEQIGQIGMQPILGDIEMMGNSYTRVSNDIKRATAASNGSIQSLNAQRSAWQMLRVQLDPISNDFRKASKEIELLDRRLGKLQQTQSRRMGGMQMAQAAGAAISGGIFGGPEGFLGGAIGGLTGGVGGAFVGAAAGAQVGMLRQQLGGFADYAAQIQKMQIALRDAAGSQDQFNQAVAAANSAVRNLNVPQDVAIQGMTKLTAAVRGAGGQVSDAELVFKNVTSAIKATGGSAQDVDGAITAMVQVFSKGKVSAEELSGQLGERLPGAVTKFAKANDMTLPELQKALEQGQVGLNELMNFIVQLGDEYAGTASKIADSSQDAGARLTVAFNDMRIAIGETLQPVGAQFQEVFADFIVNITPSLVAAAKAVGSGIKFIIDNASQIGAVVEFAAKLAGVTLALKALQAMQGPIATLFLALQNGFAASSAQAAAAQTRIIAFGTAVKAVAASLVAPLIITVAISGAQVVISWLNKVKEAQDRVKKAATATRGESWVQEIGGSAADYATLKNQVQAAGDTYQYLADKIKAARQEMASTPFKPRREFLAQQIAADEAQMAVAQSRYRAGITALGARQPTRPALTQFPNVAGDGASEAKSAAKEQKNLYQQALEQIRAHNELLAQQGRLNEIVAGTEHARAEAALNAANAAIEGRKKELDLALKMGQITKPVYDLQVTAVKKQGEIVRAEFAKTQNKIDQESRKIYDDLFAPGGAFSDQELSPLERALDELRQKIATAEARFKELGGAAAEKGLTAIKNLEDQDYTNLATRTVIGGDIKSLEEQVTQLKNMGSELSTLDQLVIKYGKDWDDLDAGLKAHLTSLAQQKDRLEMLRETIGSLAQSIQGSIGSAISTAVSSLVTGAENIKTTLASMFEAIGKAFIDMAAQIIAKQLVMIALGTISKALGFMPSGSSGGGAPGVQTNPVSPGTIDIAPSLPGAIKTAKGGYFAGGMANLPGNNIQPFASGGIVTKPTFFKFANGGAMSAGVMGEAGPEAIMPLTRGADGKLGVVAKLNAAKSKYSAGSSTAAEEAAAFAAQSQSDASFGTAQINISGGTLVFNDQNYVKADQIPAIISQSSKMGQAMAIKQLQMSATTRKKLGL